MPTSSTPDTWTSRLSAQQLDADGVNWFREENAGTARIWGLEGELQAEPIEGLRVDASFGYVNYLLLSNGGNTLLFTGNNCNGETCYSPRTPKLTSAFGLQYSLPIAGGSLTPRLDWTYQSKIYFVTNNGCFTQTGQRVAVPARRAPMHCSTPA